MSGYEISIKEGISLFTSVRSYITLFEEMSVTIKCNDCQFNSIFHKKNNFWPTGPNDPSIGHMLIIHCLDMNQSMGNYALISVQWEWVKVAAVKEKKFYSRHSLSHVFENISLESEGMLCNLGSIL